MKYFPLIAQFFMLDPAAKSCSCTYDLTGTNDVTQVPRTISSQSRAAKVIWSQLKMSLRERNQHFSSAWSHTVGQKPCKPAFQTLSQSLRLKSPGDTPAEAAGKGWSLPIVQIKSRLGAIKDEKEGRSGLRRHLEPMKGALVYTGNLPDRDFSFQRMGFHGWTPFGMRQGWGCPGEDQSWPESRKG